MWLNSYNYPMMKAAIIAAAGSGSRLGAEKPKALVELLGESLISRSFKAIIASEVADIVIIVIPEGYKDEFKKVMPNDAGYSLVFGGKTRAESVARGVRAVPDECGIIGIHDAARPLVMPKDISAVFRAAEEYGAAALAMPLRDTIKVVENGWIVNTRPREGLYLVQTPQVFRRDLLLRGLKAAQSDARPTDDCAVVEALGERIKVVKGSPDNIKITYPEDLKLAETLISDRRGI